MTFNIKEYIQPAQFPQVLWIPHNAQKRHPSQDHHIQWGSSHLWCHQGISQHHLILGGQVPSSYQRHSAACEPYHVSSTTPREGTIQATTRPSSPPKVILVIPQIITLLGFCLINTYFPFQGKYYKQVHGTAMGSPISPLSANLFMEEFEIMAISSTPHPAYSLHLWMTPLSSNRQNTVTSSSSTSTPKTPISSSLLRTPKKMVTYPF